MRYTLAVILMVVGVVVGGLGILQKTVWAPEGTITATAKIDASAPAVVIEPGVLNLYETPATLTATGTGELTIAQAPIESVDAWLGKSAAQRVTGLSAEGVLSTKAVQGEASVPNPGGADLWESEVSGTDTVGLDWKQEANRTGFLIAGDGTQGTVSTVTITWPNHASTPWAIPLMIVGGILLIGGLVLFIIGRRGAKRELARRRARQERRRKLAEYGSAFVIVPVLALTGCSAPELPTPEPSAAPTTAMAGVTEPQVRRILDATRSTVEAADATLDRKKLATRVGGPALTQREDLYTIKKKVKDQKLPPAVATEKVVLDYTAATDTWPRITSVVTSAGSDVQLLVFSQETPREAYKLWSQTQLVPGTTMPELPDARQGSALLAPDASGLAATPQNVIKDYAKALTDGDKSKAAKGFASDDFAASVWKNQKDQKKAAESGKATVKYTYKPGKELVAQGTAGDEAIVTGIIEASVTITPQTQSGLTGTLSLKSPQKELTGESSTSKAVTTKTHQVLTFLVPKSGKIRLIGGLETLSGATLK